MSNLYYYNRPETSQPPSTPQHTTAATSHQQHSHHPHHQLPHSPTPAMSSFPLLHHPHHPQHPQHPHHQLRTTGNLTAATATLGFPSHSWAGEQRHSSPPAASFQPSAQQSPPPSAVSSSAHQLMTQPPPPSQPAAPRASPTLYDDTAILQMLGNQLSGIDLNRPNASTRINNINTNINNSNSNNNNNSSSSGNNHNNNNDPSNIALSPLQPTVAPTNPRDRNQMVAQLHSQQRHQASLQKHHVHQNHSPTVFDPSEFPSLAGPPAAQQQHQALNSLGFELHAAQQLGPLNLGTNATLTAPQHPQPQPLVQQALATPTSSNTTTTAAMAPAPDDLSDIASYHDLFAPYGEGRVKAVDALTGGSSSVDREFQMQNEDFPALGGVGVPHLVAARTSATANLAQSPTSAVETTGRQQQQHQHDYQQQLRQGQGQHSQFDTGFGSATSGKSFQQTHAQSKAPSLLFDHSLQHAFLSSPDARRTSKVNATLGQQQQLQQQQKQHHQQLSNISNNSDSVFGPRLINGSEAPGGGNGRIPISSTPGFIPNGDGGADTDLPNSSSLMASAYERHAPFAHLVAGGVHSGPMSSGVTQNDSNNAFSMKGLLLDADQKDVLSIGLDLTTLGLNLNSSYPLHKTFDNPWEGGQAAAAMQRNSMIATDDAVHPQHYQQSEQQQQQQQSVIGDTRHTSNNNQRISSASLQLMSLSPSWKPGNQQLQEMDIKLPTCYFMQPPSLGGNHFEKFLSQSLFYIFYNMPRDMLQILAAVELYKRKWRYHKDLKLWFCADADHESQPQHAAQTNDFAPDGKYLYFDIKTWEKRPFADSNQSFGQGFMTERELYSISVPPL